MSKSNPGSIGCVGALIIILLVLAFNWYIGGMEVYYLANFWHGYFTHQPLKLPSLPVHTAGLFLYETAFPFVLATWVLSFILQ